MRCRPTASHRWFAQCSWRTTTLDLFVFVLVTNLQPVLAGMLAADQRPEGRKWNLEVAEYRAIITVFNFQDVAVPSMLLINSDCLRVPRLIDYRPLGTNRS